MFLENGPRELPAGTCDRMIALLVVGEIKRQIKFDDDIATYEGLSLLRTIFVIFGYFHSY